MGLGYTYQDSFVLVGSKSGTTRTGVTLTARYDVANKTKAFETGGASKVNLAVRYVSGASETSNSLQLRVETSQDGTNYYRIPNESVSGATSTLTLREFSITQATDYGELAYDTRTGTFASGLVLSGATSSGTGVIISDSITNSTSGTLLLSNISGTFVDNEPLTDTGTGVALANGILTSITHFSLPLDLQDEHMKISFKETGVSTNFGTVYCEATLCGAK